MAKFQIDGSALAVTILAAAFGFSLLTGPFSWLASIAGLVLAIVLLAFDKEGVRTVSESLGFSAAVSLCLTLASAVIFRFVLANQGQTPAFEGPLASEYLPIFWVAVTVFIWVVDRSRMPSRVTYQAPAPVHLQPAASFIPHSAPPPPPVQPVPFAAPAPEPKPVPIAPAHAGAFTQPSFAAPAIEPPPPAAIAPVMPPATAIIQPQITQPAPVQPAPVTPAYVSAPAPVATAPPPQAIQIPAGKEATVYVTLVGEGLNVLRAVRAEHLGRDYYRIAEDMPAGEIWQFGPGQVVRAKKKNLSSGKAMVAFEEAPRAAQ